LFLFPAEALYDLTKVPEVPASTEKASHSLLYTFFTVQAAAIHRISKQLEAGGFSCQMQGLFTDYAI